MINLTVIIDNDEALRKFRELQKVAKNATSSVVTDSDRMDAAMRRFATTLGQIGVGVSLAGLVRQIATTRGEFQQLEVAFTTLLQNKEKADALMRQMVDLAATTPFDLQGVANGARQLLAYGFAAEDITDTLTRLGNVAAGLGLPLERLTYLYGTTAVQGRVFARDMQQFTGSGIPVLQELAKMYGKTTDEINTMVSAGRIGFEEIKKVFENMTNAGGQFYNLMENQSKTITGLISNLGDAIDTMFNDIGKSQEGVISSVLQGTISLVENYQKVLDIVIQLIVAYGTYKTALIVLNTVEKLRYQAALAHGAGLTTLQALTEILTAKTKALNNALLSNPYVLAAAAAAALAVAIYKLVTAKSAEEIAYEKINTAIDTYNQKLDEQKNKVEQLHATMQDEVSTAYTKRKAYEELIRLYPELLQWYSEEEIKLLSLIDLTKELNNINDTRKEHNLQEQYDAALENVQRTNQSIEELAKSGGGQAVFGLSRALKTYEAELDEVGKRLDEFRETQKAAEEDAAPAEVKIATLQSNIDELKAQNKEIDRLIEQARKRKEDTPYAFGLYYESEDYYQGVKRLNLMQINAKQGEIDTLSSGGGKSEVRNKSYWEGLKEEAEAALESMDVSLKGTAKWNELIAKIAEYDSKIKQYSVSSKTVTDASKVHEELSNLIIASELALQQSRIDIMKDGIAKELAQIELNTQKKVQAIENERKKELEASGQKPTGKLSTKREEEYAKRTTNAQEEGDAASVAAKLKYAKEIDAISKQITDSSLTEEERRVQGIKDKYDELREWIKNALEGGTITQEQADVFGVKIDQAETADTLKGIIDAYGTAEDKITKIQQNAESARKTAREQGREDLISKINKKEQEDIGAVKAEELMKTDDWINLFQNLDALSSKEIRRIIDNINEQLKNANLDPINLQAIINQLDQAQQTAISKDPFWGTIASIEKYKKSLEEAKTAWEAYAKAIGTADESEAYTKATKAQIKADNDRIQAWQSAQKAAADTANALASVSGALEQMGVEVPAEVEGLMGALNSFASIDITRPFSIVTGVIGGLASLVGGIFGGRNQRAEKRIKRLQEQVEVLEKSYDKLGDAVEKAYSKDAKGLIEDQNKLLEQQKVLIQQQIKEEQSKKNSDKDRIKEWQEQLEEIDKRIADNKEKAIDAIFGEDLKSAIDNFAEAYADAWANGEDRAKSAKDVVRNMMRQMVTESIKSAIQSSEAMKKIREKLTEFYEDNVLSEWEQDYIYKMAEELQQELDSQFGWADSLMTDKGAEAQTATARGFQAMSQETGSELNGRFTAIQGDVHDIKAFVIEQTNNGAMLLYETMNIRDIMIQLNGNVADIRTYTRVLPAMRETLVAINRKLDNI